MKLLLVLLLSFFVSSIPYATDFFVYNCNYISSENLVKKLSIFPIKGKYTPSNHSNIIFFGQKSQYDYFLKVAKQFDIKPIMIKGNIRIKNIAFSKEKALLNLNQSNRSQEQIATFTGLSGSHIKVQLGQETVREFQHFFQILDTGLYLDIVAIKIGNHFELEISIKSSTQNDQTFYISQNIRVPSNTWTSIGNFKDSSQGKTKSLPAKLDSIYQKYQSSIQLDASIIINSLNY
ncbi:hypothetical protein MJH12_19735 [bacterium]|nr:hypothetical protein [bacterium]